MHPLKGSIESIMSKKGLDPKAMILEQDDECTAYGYRDGNTTIVVCLIESNGSFWLKLEFAVGRIGTLDGNALLAKTCHLLENCFVPVRPALLEDMLVIRSMVSADTYRQEYIDFLLAAGVGLSEELQENLPMAPRHLKAVYAA